MKQYWVSRSVKTGWVFWPDEDTYRDVCEAMPNDYYNGRPATECEENFIQRLMDIAALARKE